MLKIHQWACFWLQALAAPCASLAAGLPLLVGTGSFEGS